MTRRARHCIIAALFAVPICFYSYTSILGTGFGSCDICGAPETHFLVDKDGAHSFCKLHFIEHERRHKEVDVREAQHDRWPKSVTP